MKIKAGEFKIIGEGLEEILTKEIPIKPAYWLARFLTKLTTEVISFEKARLGLLIKYAKKDEDGKPILITEKNKDGKDINRYDILDNKAFEEEFTQLAEEEIEIDFKPIKLSDIDVEVCEKCGRKKLVIKPIILAKLGKVIEE